MPLLWKTFEIEDVQFHRVRQFHATGTEWQLTPPAEFGNVFNDFKSTCANFVGFAASTTCVSRRP